MFSGNTLCLAWVVCVGVCMLPYIHGEPRYAGNCRKNFPADCTTPNTICGPPGNCPNNICQWKCHYCTCKKAQQCYLAGPDTTACNCTGTGYTGSTCEIDIDECASGPCKNGGKCCNGENRYDCFCAPGYTGTNCEIDIDECTLGNWCLNGGTCHNGINQYTCTCADGFTGKNCEIDIDECTSPEQCQNGGICVDGIGGYSCDCRAGFTGQNCETDIDECDGHNPCGGCGYSCSNTIGGYCCE